ncbi:hypothetical protein DV735_g5424, partial [Chaetothyriales sp. CBS 134920]
MADTSAAVPTPTAQEQPLSSTDKAPELSQATDARFLAHATQAEDGEFYMDRDQFIEAIAPADEDYHKIKREQYGIFFTIADRQQRGRITRSEWAVFDNLMTKSGSEYEMAFRVFDVGGTGTVSEEQLQRVYEQNRDPNGVAFNFSSDWAALYFGGKGHRHDFTFEEFAQMLRGLQGERIRQAFHRYDSDKDGYIDPEHFRTIILSTAAHKLSDHVLDNLPTLSNISAGAKIPYADVRAFQNLMHDMDLVELVIRNVTHKSPDGRTDRTEFLNECGRLTRFSQITPKEADVLFHFAGIDSDTGRLSLDDFKKVFDASWQATKPGPLENRARESEHSSLLSNILEPIHHFALGSIAGAFGAFMVYPIDLVKTRMQNQRSSRPGERLYLNSVDCAKKVLRNEGVRGLYSGVLPQLVGVAPEKAIKLTVNDLVRGHFTDPKTGAIPLPAEILAGGTAGACQVVFTNPLEIVKIRLQVQGELAKRSDAAPRRSAMWIVRNLGIMGLYKGAAACLCRDVPFSAIYFPTYSHLKRDLFGESPEKKLGVMQLLTAGAIAGMPAAYLTTPFDVIKTRLQVEARKGDTTYNGIRDCARKIYRDEGFRAFFKGGPARILRSSPQFGFTLAAYEVLNTLLPFHGSADPADSVRDPDPGVGLREAKAPLPYLRCRNALKVLLDMDPGFGLARPPPPKTAAASAWLGADKQ